jgi:hypothetical protein
MPGMRREAVPRRDGGELKFIVVFTAAIVVFEIVKYVWLLTRDDREKEDVE